MRNKRIHEAVMEHGYTLTALQKHLGLHPSTLSRIVKRIGEEKNAKNKVWPRSRKETTVWETGKMVSPLATHRPTMEAGAEKETRATRKVGNSTKPWLTEVKRACLKKGGPVCHLCSCTPKGTRTFSRGLLGNTC